MTGVFQEEPVCIFCGTTSPEEDDGVRYLVAPAGRHQGICRDCLFQTADFMARGKPGRRYPRDAGLDQHLRRLAARILLDAPPLNDAEVLAGHRQIDWDRSSQNTNRPVHETQTEDGAGTTCAQDVQDAFLAILTRITEGDQ